MFLLFFPFSVMNIEVLPLGEARVVITPICTCDCNVSHVTITHTKLIMLCIYSNISHVSHACHMTGSE